PVSQFLVKFTNPTLKPMRRVIPGMFGIDMSSIVLALLLQIAATSLLLLINGLGFVNPILLLVWAILGCLAMLANIYFFAILVSIILSWVAPGSYNPLVLLLHQLTEPVLTPFRKLLPSMGGLDLSPIFVFIVINVMQIILKHLGAGVGLHPSLVIGF
ncbi:MAG: YggT family protein, partial [Spongiibacteraceae bacterium]|nr:YggT family protein [Spongiibacteraceae bacterium]